MRSAICSTDAYWSRIRLWPHVGGPPDRRLSGGGDPDRRVGRLHRWGLDDDVVEGPVPAVVREPLPGRPRSQEHLERLLEARIGLVLIDVEAAELRVPVALADAEVDAAARDHVQRRRLLGEQDGVVPWQDHDARPQAKRRGAGGDARLQHQRRRDLVPAAEVMLDQERGLEPQRLGLDVEAPRSR